MRFWNVFLTAIVLTTLTPVRGAASTTTVYIAQSTAGSANGGSCANAYPVTFFNTSSNWGSGASQIGPGTTVHLCGVITTELTVRGRGSSGAPITILFQPNAQIRLPACDNTNGCLSINGASYIVVDGGTPCGPGTACAATALPCIANASACGTGSIVQTSNGTLPSTVTNITCSGGVATVTGPNRFGFNLAPYPAVQPVQISGNSVSSYNGSWTVASNNDSTNTFTFNTACNGTGTGGLAGVLCPSGAFCANYQNALIIAGVCTNCEARNLILGPVGWTTATVSGGGSGAGGTFNLSGCNGCTTKIHDNVMPYGVVDYVPAGTGDSGLQIYNNEIYNFNGAINIAATTSGEVLSGAQIYGNYLHDSALYDAPGCPDHHDGIHVWGLSGGVISGINFYNNRIGGNFGGCATGAIFFEGTVRNSRIYNNYVDITYTQENNGIVNVNGDGVGGGYSIYNNTIIGNNTNDTCFAIDSPLIAFENNIITGCWTETLFRYPSTVTTWDHNVYGCQNLMGISCGSGPFNSVIVSVNSMSAYTWYSLAGWQTFCSCDTHSTTDYTASGLGINPNGTLQSTSSARGIGANLMSLGITTLNSDPAGNTRPASGAWADGAYQYLAVSAVAPPTSLTVIAQ